ncbi:hypothetical protein LCGC14_1612160, partial [marine sediment metagenome]
LRSRVHLTWWHAHGQGPSFVCLPLGQRFIASGRKGLDKCCTWAETRRSVTVSAEQRAKVPSPDYWIPVPATGSRPPALRRHWTPVSSTPLDQPHGYWSTAPSNGSAAPVLERHWTPENPWKNRKTNHNAQTVTPGKESVTLLSQVEALLLAESITASDEAVSIPPLLSQTVTRLCVGCGQPLEGKRPQAKAHGAACRQRAYRRQKKAGAQAQDQREAGHRAEHKQADPVHTAIG